MYRRTRSYIYWCNWLIFWSLIVALESFRPLIALSLLKLGRSLASLEFFRKRELIRVLSTSWSAGDEKVLKTEGSWFGY